MKQIDLISIYGIFKQNDYNKVYKILYDKNLLKYNSIITDTYFYINITKQVFLKFKNYILKNLKNIKLSIKKSLTKYIYIDDEKCHITNDKNNSNTISQMTRKKAVKRIKSGSMTIKHNQYGNRKSNRRIITKNRTSRKTNTKT